jgi:hypothetical protein
VQDERDPLRGRQCVEHDEQRETDRVREQGLALGVGLGRRAGGRLGRIGVQGHLGPRPARLQDVQAQPRHDRGQPRLQVLDRARVRAAEPQPRLLDGVVGLARRAEHPVGHRRQAGSLPFEALGEPVDLVHRSRSCVEVLIGPRPVRRRRM